MVVLTPPSRRSLIRQLKSFVQWYMSNNKCKEYVAEIFYAAIRAVDIRALVTFHVDMIGPAFRRSKYNRFLTIGFGKAVCPMARATEESAGDLIEEGIVITKYGHNINQDSGVESQKSKIKIHEAGHPVPDENGEAATEEIIDLVKGLNEKSFLLCLISGGGSALFVSPAEGMTLADKKKVTDLLLKSGATIEELNTIRKHISKVKGGRLAQIAYPSKIISLIISDVIGDRLDTIASGPTSPDLTTYHDAYKVIQNYGLIELIPGSVLAHIQKGVQGLVPETPKMGDRVFGQVENIIMGSNKKALEAAKTREESLGF